MAVYKPLLAVKQKNAFGIQSNPESISNLIFRKAYNSNLYIRANRN